MWVSPKITASSNPDCGLGGLRSGCQESTFLPEGSPHIAHTAYKLTSLVGIMEKISIGIRLFVLPKTRFHAKFLWSGPIKLLSRLIKPWFFPCSFRFILLYHYAKENEIVMGYGYIYKYCVTADVVRCRIYMGFVLSNSLGRGKKGREINVSCTPMRASFTRFARYWKRGKGIIANGSR